MSADRPRTAGAALLPLVIAMAMAAVAAATESPDGEFLEYLGLWEAADDEWLLLQDVPGDTADSEPGEPPPGDDGKSAENVDEQRN